MISRVASGISYADRYPILCRQPNYSRLNMDYANYSAVRAKGARVVGGEEEGIVDHESTLIRFPEHIWYQIGPIAGDVVRVVQVQRSTGDQGIVIRSDNDVLRVQGGELSAHIRIGCDCSGEIVVERA